MPNLEWEVPHTLTTTEGSLELNQVDAMTGRKYQIQPDYKIVPAIRATTDNLAQADGSVLHTRWKTGLVASLTVHYLQTLGADESYVPACGATLREMHDDLMLHLNAIRQLNGTQRLLWVPTDYSTGGGLERMLDDIELLTWAEPVRDGTETGVTFSIECPYPYAIDSVQTLTSIASGGSSTLTNSGSSDFLPVMKAYGPTSAFTITNSTTGLAVEYDSTRPGASSIAGGHYAELDFFRGTITLDGNVSFLDAGLVPTTTDFFPLAHGANQILASGAAIDVLWNLAWS